MSETKLVVRDVTRDISLTCHGSDAHRAVAALSADPVTIEELDVALQRFMKVEPHEFFHCAVEYVDDEPWDSGLVVIDLAARLIVVDSTYFATNHCGQVLYRNADHCTDVPIGYSLSEVWEIKNDRSRWQQLAEDRRREQLGKTRPDTRAILYGRPLLEFLASACWNEFHSCDQKLLALAENPSNDPGTTASDAAVNELLHDPIFSGDEGMKSQIYDRLKEIHASWLMSLREEFSGKTPRDVLLAERERLSDDMQHRCDQWARTLECPRGLDMSSHAFLFGGFGTHELVKYFEMIRELLWSCWNELSELVRTGDGSASITSLGLAGFLNSEVPRLERVRDEWLNTPDPECHLRTPRSMIDRERARLPEALFGRDAMIDPDCPCCQMLAELPGPTFMHLDSSGMDWEFPFDIYCRTREDWEAQQREYTDSNQSTSDAGMPFGMSKTDSDRNPSVWSRSFSMAESTDLPLGVRLLGIAWHVAELAMELNEQADSESLTDQLNRDFRNLREVLKFDPRASTGAV